MYKLSIIIPVYNVQDFLAYNIDSILKTNNNRIEIILVDDGSTDNSRQICEKYAKENDNIFYTYQKNQGPGIARNTGLHMAHGEWIYFVDADDFLFTDGLSELLSVIEKDCLSDLIVFNTYSYYESENRYEEFTGECYKGIVNGVSGIDFFTNVLKRDITYGYCMCFYIVKRRLIRENNLFSDVGTSADTTFTARLWLLSQYVRYLPIDVYAYRREQPGSITHNISLKWIITLANRVKNNIDFINNNKLRNEHHDMFLLSNYNLLLVVLAHSTKLKKNEREKVELLLNEIKPKLVLRDKSNKKYMGWKLWIVNLLSKVICYQTIIKIWSVKNRFIRYVTK